MSDHSSESAASTIEQLALKVTSKPVLLGVENAQVGDLHSDEPGLSYLAKRLYMKAGYDDKKALKAAMMLSALFMRETGDPDVSLHTGDALSISRDGALLIRNESGVSKEYRVSFPEVLAQQERKFQEEKIVSRARTEDCALREVVSSEHLSAASAFLQDLHKLRLAVPNFSMMVSSSLLAPDDAVRDGFISSAQQNALPGYYFGKIFYGKETTPPTKPDALLFAVHPITGKVFLFSGSDGRLLAETTSHYMLQPVINILKTPSPVPSDSLDVPSVSEAVKPTLQMQLQTTLRDTLNRNFILQNKSLPQFGIEAYTITFKDQPGREFYVAANQKGSTIKYRLSERLEPHTGQMNDRTLQNWTSNFDSVVDVLRTA